MNVGGQLADVAGDGAQTRHLVETALQLGLWRNARRATIIGMTEERATESDVESDLDPLADEARSARIRELLANPGHHGGDSVRFIREMRNNRFEENWRSQGGTTGDDGPALTHRQV